VSSGSTGYRPPESLAREWKLVLGRPFGGGSAAYVVSAHTAVGRDVVLKVALPEGLEGDSPFAAEIQTLRLADAVGAGSAYVQLLEVAADGRAVLLERLGRPLASLDLRVEHQIDAIVDTVSRGWRPLQPGHGLRTGRDQAEWLADFITRTWESTGRPCAEATVGRAVAAATTRAGAFDPVTAVMVHGDAHPANVLEDLDAGRKQLRCKLIDPDAMVSEPAHDLGVMLRDWSTVLLEPGRDAAALGRAWCRRAARRSEVDEEAVWQWAFVERVATGLYLARLGDSAGSDLLEVAARWTA
jgi:streptomycin 6-kinase